MNYDLMRKQQEEPSEEPLWDVLSIWTDQCTG